MGAGKSTVGRLLADALGWQFLDLDNQIETSTGKDIPTQFRDSGEAAFRALETEALLATQALSQSVIACGGGVILDEENRDFLKQEMTLWLDVSPDMAAARIESSTHRPLLEGEDPRVKLKALLESRYEAYVATARKRFSTDGESAEAIKERIVAFLREQND